MGWGARQARPTASASATPPRREQSRQSRQREHGNVGNEAPERRSDDEALRQRQAFVALTEHGAGDDVAHGGECDQLGRQQQQAGDDRAINGHSHGLI